MNNRHMKHCSPNASTSFEILGDLRVTVQEEHNPYQLPLAELFAMAARRNKKRGFLFVSKLLGKHIPVRPHVALLAGNLLAAEVLRVGFAQQTAAWARLTEQMVSALRDHTQAEAVWRQVQQERLAVPEPALVIGFAETATGLGHAVFEALDGPVRYLHTSREEIVGLTPVLAFEEEHSHATAHRCYALDPAFFCGDEPVVLVDDEITTGKTALNIIRDLQAKHPRRRYVVAALLDWRSEADIARYRELEAELGVEIRTVALLKGRIDVAGSPVETAEQTVQQADQTTGQPHVLEKVLVDLKPFGLAHVFSKCATTGDINHAPYLQATGRFGMTTADRARAEEGIATVGQQLRQLRRGARVLCLGTGEFMYLPMRLAGELGDDVVYMSTTRSPIHPCDRDGYAIRCGWAYPSPDDPSITHHVYNTLPGAFDELFVFLERDWPPARLQPMLDTLTSLGIPRVHLVVCATEAARLPEIPAPTPIGSYAPDDVVFLLTDLSAVMQETGTEDREEAIQSGGQHYSEMLPIEYRPTAAYLSLYREMLGRTARQVALAVGTVAELILDKRGSHLVLASLARAGTPAGILIKRWLKQMHDLTVPHYSLSIIRGKGVDRNALLYIRQQHAHAAVQFVDGWTGKGAITQVLQASLQALQEEHGLRFDPDLAVLADPGHCAVTYGTRDDFLIPSACLNATVSGLVSRTVQRDDLLGPLDFHGAKWYREWAADDLSLPFVEAVAAHFAEVRAEALARAAFLQNKQPVATWAGRRDIALLQERYGLHDANLIKPGVGETTRVLLRRVPWKLLVQRMDNPDVQHLLLLAEERGVPVEEVPTLTYASCGLIRPRRGGDGT